MRRYSPEWFEAVDVALRDVDTGDARFTLGQEVSGDDGEIAFIIVVADGAASIAAATGTAGEADATFRTDPSTAAAIAAGSLSARDAFLDGLLLLRGDAGVLVDHSELIAEIGRATSSVPVGDE